ncbi:MAG: hypothetical protein FWB71_04965 [Defluviitaleaceae bacterium]|nr:hypothetical protein [Defluviitaleaceae bacterium]
MKDEYDFSKAVRNPHFAAKMKNGYTVIIEHDEHDEIIRVERTVKTKEQKATKIISVRGD